MKRTNLLYLAHTLIAALLISGCAANKTQDRAASSVAAPVQSEYEALINKARTTKDAKLRSERLLEAAQSLLGNGLDAQASYIFTEIDPLFLLGVALNQYQILSLELALASSDNARLKSKVDDIRLDQMLMSPISEQQKLIKLLAASYERVDEPTKAAILLAEYEGIFTNDSVSFMNERIWLLLQQAKTDTLMQYSYTGKNPNVIAWLELAKNIKLTQASLDQQYAALISWMKIHPNHPATSNPPLELELLAQLPATSPKQIILALPLSGPYANVGQAVSDGFLANYFASKTQEHPIEVKLFDTNESPIATLYKSLEKNQILGRNALIVGPLGKKSIEEIADSDYLTTPTLALNYSKDIQPHPLLNLFGLDPSDETLQSAQSMRDSKLLRVAVIAPNSDWGKRLNTSFSDQLQRFGGHVVKTSFYEDQRDLANSVAVLLATKESKDRARNMMRITRQRLETEPRRRQDIDAIFMLADNKTAKQIKPMLAFNFARDIPVYAISQTHDPFTQDENSDLNGVRFLDIPWMLSKTSPLRSKIEENIGVDAERYARFYALGADAFTLAPRLVLMTEISNSFVQGYTGTLSMGEQGKIKRTLQWAKFSRGSVKILN